MVQNLWTISVYTRKFTWRMSLASIFMCLIWIKEHSIWCAMLGGVSLSFTVQWPYLPVLCSIRWKHVLPLPGIWNHSNMEVYSIVVVTSLAMHTASHLDIYHWSALNEKLKHNKWSITAREGKKRDDEHNQGVAMETGNAGCVGEKSCVCEMLEGVWEDIV